MKRYLLLCLAAVLFIVSCRSAAAPVPFSAPVWAEKAHAALLTASEVGSGWNAFDLSDAVRAEMQALSEKPIICDLAFSAPLGITATAFQLGQNIQVISEEITVYPPGKAAQNLRALQETLTTCIEFTRGEMELTLTVTPHELAQMGDESVAFWAGLSGLANTLTIYIRLGDALVAVSGITVFGNIDVPHTEATARAAVDKARQHLR